MIKLKIGDAVLFGDDDWGIVIHIIEAEDAAQILYFSKEVEHYNICKSMINPKSGVFKGFYRPRFQNIAITDLNDGTKMKNLISKYYEVIEEDIKEVTMSEVEEKFGCKVKIVKEEIQL